MKKYFTAIELVVVVTIGAIGLTIVTVVLLTVRCLWRFING